MTRPTPNRKQPSRSDFILPPLKSALPPLKGDHGGEQGPSSSPATVAVQAGEAGSKGQPTPIGNALVNPRLPQGGRSGARLGLVVFLVCLVLGMVLVGWQAMRRARDARDRARAEALARAAAVEAQFGQALSAAELLGALARQSGGAIPNFAKVGAEVLASRPGVASMAALAGARAAGQ